MINNKIKIDILPYDQQIKLNFDKLYNKNKN